MTKKLYIKTYGCQMNVYDSERMAEVMAPEGYALVETPEAADVVVLNTCHIREKAAEKVYSDIGRLKVLRDERLRGERAGGDLVLAVGGCVGQAEGAEIMQRAPAVDMVFGPQTYHRLPKMVIAARDARALHGKARVIDTEFPAEEKFDHLPSPRGSGGPAAFLTIQEGCDKFCTFCVVPYTRGAEFSRPVEKIVAEAEKLAAVGVVELTLLGQNVNAYHGVGLDGGDWSLARLMARLGEVPGIARIRYTTSHPRDMGDDLIAAHGELAACMPYLHLPVQSGSDRVLAAMNRGHTAESYRDIIARLRALRPDLAVSSDFIVGFPGETDDDFEATMQLIRDVGFSQAYSFKYSPRPGTPASDMADQVPEEVKDARLQALQTLLFEQQKAFNVASVGQVMAVLLERVGRFEGQLIGRSPYMQAVNVDCGAAAADVIGRIAMVEILSGEPHSLKGRLATDQAA
ncbi:tRNA (N6-isopentenyl adenosine(37)-C2)-methylthiotransferase MiaB [Alphaproteobacteria bacterium LMG 31809]|uniref:tRNA-2-methylthio-N(6)-dimethylallyladenosine synthase n=1 Tax=Govanella unica TaxID=2975056 RepID=A0A9X3Z812_9PROT|nr:tRNA (N6-isopentenyl adenosine(37)-C2)-methylthiotransferase MiaB [Govania unica]